MLDKAMNAAKRSSLKRHKTGAVIVDSKGVLVSIGWSHMTNTTRSQYFSMHAELHAILRADKRERLKNATIYVATIAGRSGNITTAKPCEACEAIIRSVGIKSIVYTERSDLNGNGNRNARSSRGRGSKNVASSSRSLSTAVSKTTKGNKRV